MVISCRVSAMVQNWKHKRNRGTTKCENTHTYICPHRNSMKYLIRVQNKGKLTPEMVRRCGKHGVAVDTIDPEFLEQLAAVAVELGNVDRHDAVRALHPVFAEKKFINSYLVVLFDMSPSVVSKSLRDPMRGTHGLGRPHVLNKVEEEAVISHVRDCQKRGHSEAMSKSTEWINCELLKGQKKVSHSYLYMSPHIRESLKPTTPQIVDKGVREISDDVAARAKAHVETAKKSRTSVSGAIHDF